MQRGKTSLEYQLPSMPYDILRWWLSDYTNCIYNDNFSFQCHLKLCWLVLFFSLVLMVNYHEILLLIWSLNFTKKFTSWFFAKWKKKCSEITSMEAEMEVILDLSCTCIPNLATNQPSFRLALCQIWSTLKHIKAMVFIWLLMYLNERSSAAIEITRGEPLTYIHVLSSSSNWPYRSNP